MSEHSSKIQDTNFYKTFRTFIAEVEQETIKYRYLLPNSKDFNQEKNNLAAKYLANIFKLCFKRIETAFNSRLPAQWEEGKPNTNNERQQTSTAGEIDRKSLICVTDDKSEGFKSITSSELKSSSVQHIISLLHRLQIFATHDVLMQVTREMAKERVLHRMWKKNEQNNIENQKMSELIAAKEETLEFEENAKREAREAHEYDVQRMIASNANEMKALLELSCNKGKLLYSEMRMEEIKMNEVYARSVEENEKSEEKMRRFEAEEKQKKAALEDRIQNALRKYDNEISGRFHKLEKLKRILARNNEVLAKWKIKYAKQDVIYNRILLEIETEDLRVREEKLLLFMMNRSAVIIQRAFRLVLSKRKTKKKKGKKGKK